MLTELFGVVDGEIVSDKENVEKQDLDYKMYHKIYLKDMEYHEDIKQDSLQLQYYSTEKENVKVQLVVRNGHIYIQSENPVEVVDENSGIELIDDHYQKISKESYEDYLFDKEHIMTNQKKLKYTSIYNVFTMLFSGFQKIFQYSVLKKFLLIGFFISAMFSVFAISQMFGSTNIKDKNFITTNRDYLNLLLNDQNKIQKYIQYEQLDFVNYLLLGNSKVNFTIDYDDYYQTMQVKEQAEASMVSKELISEEDIVYGRMIENPYEVIIDEMVINEIFHFQLSKQVGVINQEDLLGRILKFGNGNMTINKKSNLKPFQIVGITNLENPCIYVDPSMFIDILNNSSTTDTQIMASNSIQNNSEISLKNIELVKEDIILTKGRMPQNDYEIIVNRNHQTEMKLNKTIDTTVNSQKLKVVGYYDSKYGNDEYYANKNTVKYQLIEKSQNITISAKDKQKAMEYFISEKQNIEDIYQKDRDAYITQIQPKIIASLTVSGVILLISLIEIFLMIRSSFLSRIKEVGILRAIGVKKSDIYKMFLGEIIAINLCIGLPGILFMSYIVSNLTKLSYIGDQFLLNGTVVGLSIVLMFVFHILVGLLPVFHTMRKTPAKILASNHVD